MASRIIHNAIATAVAERYPIRDQARFLLGALLPDAYTPERSTRDSHLKISLENGQKKTYDLDRFRSLFREELTTDDLYRGYYLHLIQDLCFRDFVYNRHGWDPSVPGNVARLHKDYALANRYVAEHYRVTCPLELPKGFSEERICMLYPFDVERLVADLEADVSETVTGEPFFFTTAMADAFLAIATESSLSELAALDRGTGLADMHQLAWSNQRPADSTLKGATV